MILLAAGLIAGITAKAALKPDGFIHALRSIDASEFNGDISGGLTDDGVIKRYRQSSTNHPLAQEFASRIRAAEAVVDSFDGPLPEDRLKQLSVEAEYDGNNLLTRALVALAYESPQGDDTFATPIDRFNYLNRVISQPPAIDTVATYGDAFYDLFIKAFDGFSERPSNVLITGDALYYDTFLQTHRALYECIPFAVNHWGTLATELEADGHNAEAFQLRQWLGEICFGIIDVDRDPSLQLIAARGLITVFGENEAIAKPLRKLIDDHTTNRKIPYTDSRISPFSNYETLAPVEYADAFDSFARFTAASALFVGSALVALMSLTVFILPMSPHRPNKDQSYPLGARAGLYALIVVIVPLALVWRGADLFQAGEHPYLSRDWMVAALLAFGVIGGALTIIRAIIDNAVGSTLSERLRWGCVGLALFVAAGLMLAAPYQTLVWPLRSLAIVDNWLTAAVLIALFLLAAIAMARVPASRLARVAAICALLFAIQSATLHSLHRGADRRYQNAVVTNHADPLGARLGSDWRKTYIDPARDAFNELQP